MRRKRRWLAALPALVVLVGTADAADRRLVDAINAGDRTTVQVLLKQGVDVNVPDADGTTALHWAVRHDDLALVNLLIRAKANVRAANRYGVLPIRLAAINGNAAIVEALLKSGADPNSSTPEGETVLLTAARSGSVDTVRLLASHGADVNAKERWLGETALMWAASENHPAVVRTLIELGADVNAKSNVTGTPKLEFTRSGGPNIPFPVGGWTALMHAARQGSIDAARALVDGKADLDAQDPDGTSAMIFAIINAHYDLAAMLVERGANPGVADSSGMAALFAAANMSTLQWIEGWPHPIQNDKLDASDLVKILLQHGADPNQPLRGTLLRRHHFRPDGSLSAGTTPLMRAVRTGDFVVVSILLDHGADPFIRLRNGTTSLMMATSGSGFLSGEGPRVRVPTEEGLIATIKLLLGRGVDINAYNNTGATALSNAVGRGTKDVVKFLAEQGARLDMRNKAGRTPLDVARAGRRVPGEDVLVVDDQMISLVRQLAEAAKNSPRVQ
jgi:ankyrin repeat protein